MVNEPAASDESGLADEPREDDADEDRFEVDVILTPRNDTGFYQAEIVASEGANPAEMVRNLADLLESTLRENESEYDGAFVQGARSGHVFDDGSRVSLSDDERRD